MPGIVIHLKAGDATDNLDGWHLRLYRVIRRIAGEAGIAVTLRVRDPDIAVGTRGVGDGRFDDGNLHILDDRSVRAPNVLNAGVAYLWEFWHLDPAGVKAFSSIGSRDYDPDAVPYRRARPFFERLRARYLDRRRSKYDQPEATEVIPEGCLAVFFQGSYPRDAGATPFGDFEMLDIVRGGAGDRRVVVKPHPLASTSSDRRELRRLARADRGLIVTDANVHDILGACAATVSINSTVALEGFLHRKPAILFGAADFHHYAGTVAEAASFAAVLARELGRTGGYAQYLAWYFQDNCLALDDPALDDRIWEIFARAGFPRAAFG